MFGTSTLMADTEISKEILWIKQNLVKNRNWPEWPVGYLQSEEELNVGPAPNTNPSGSKEEELGP